MPAPSVRSFTSGRSNSTNVTVTMPSGVSVGDVCVLYSCGWPNLVLSTPSGWSFLGFTTAADSVRLTIHYRIIDGTEPSSYSLTGPSGGNWIGWANVAYQGASAVRVSFTAASHNPPNFIPSWGPAETLWVAGIGYRGSPNQVTAVPSGFIGRIDTDTQVSNQNSVTIAHLVDEVGSKDPSAFTSSAGVARSISFTLGLMPSSVNLWTPSDLDGLLAWYSSSNLSGADNSDVQTLTDLSGNGRTLDAWNASKPKLRTSLSFTLNHYPTIEFGTSLCAMRYAGVSEFDVNSGMFTITVFRATTAVTNARVVEVSGRTTHPTQCVGFGQGNIVTTGAVTPWAVSENSRSGVIKSQHILLGSDIQHTGSPPYPVAANPWPTTNSFGLRGGVAEVIVCSMPSASDILKLQGYLNWKYGLQANLSTDHTYRYSPPAKRWAYPSLRGAVLGYMASRDTGSAASDQFTVEGSQDGTLTNGATRVNDGGLAYSFDGVDDYIVTPSLTITGNKLTVACWANLTTTTGVQMLVSQYGASATNRGWYLANINGALRFLVSPDGSSVPWGQGGTVLTGWHHYAGVLTGTAFQLYIDGVAVTTTLTGTYPSTIFNSTENLQVGSRHGTDSPMGGLIDDVVIYSRTLSPTEIGYLASTRGAAYQQTGTGTGTRRRRSTMGAGIL